MTKYKTLTIWKEAMRITEKVYLISNEISNEEKFGLISQMRRAAVSISSNIAEGAGRNNIKEFRQFVGIASGSTFELESQLILSMRLGLITDEKGVELINDLELLQKRIYKFLEFLNRRSKVKVTT